MNPLQDACVNPAHIQHGPVARRLDRTKPHTPSGKRFDVFQIERGELRRHSLRTSILKRTPRSHRRLPRTLLRT
jgi:hypothetical protein